MEVFIRLRVLVFAIGSDGMFFVKLFPEGSADPVATSADLDSDHIPAHANNNNSF